MESALCEHKRLGQPFVNEVFCHDCNTWLKTDDINPANLPPSNPDSIWPQETEADICSHEMTIQEGAEIRCCKCKKVLKTCKHEQVAWRDVLGVPKEFCELCGTFLREVPPHPCTIPPSLPSSVEKQYVAGFLFSPDRSHVVLIEKAKPEWQAGRMNGVGGKIEAGESPEQAMQREFLEEAGVDIPDWNMFCKLNWRGGCVYFFRAFGDTSKCYTVTDEIIRRVPCDERMHGFKIIPNLKWLVAMALDSHVGSAIVEDMS